MLLSAISGGSATSTRASYSQAASPDPVADDPGRRDLGRAGHGGLDQLEQHRGRRPRGAKISPPASRSSARSSIIRGSPAWFEAQAAVRLAGPGAPHQAHQRRCRSPRLRGFSTVPEGRCPADLGEPPRSPAPGGAGPFIPVLRGRFHLNPTCSSVNTVKQCAEAEGPASTREAFSRLKIQPPSATRPRCGDRRLGPARPSLMPSPIIHWSVSSRGSSPKLAQYDGARPDRPRVFLPPAPTSPPRTWWPV